MFGFSHANEITAPQMTIFLPETYHPILLKQRAKRMRKENPKEHGDKYAELERADFSLHSIITRTLARPLVMLVVEPIMITVTIYLSVSHSTSILVALSFKLTGPPLLQVVYGLLFVHLSAARRHHQNSKI